MLLAIVLPISLLAAGTAANAATGARTLESTPTCTQCHASFTLPYKKGWTFISHPLNICAVFTASGTISYTVRTDALDHLYYSNQKLNAPRLSVHIDAYSRKFRDCAPSKRVSKMRIGQHWSGYSCSFNPSISATFPWGVGISGWPNCGDREQAAYTTGYGAGTGANQNNSGSPSSFGNLNNVLRAPCYGIFVSGVFYEGNNSDSYNAGNSPGAQKVCLTKLP